MTAEDWPAGRVPAPVLPGLWPEGDAGAPGGAVRCVVCAAGLRNLGDGIDHAESTGRNGVTFVGGTDRVWSLVPADLPTMDEVALLQRRRRP